MCNNCCLGVRSVTVGIGVIGEEVDRFYCTCDQGRALKADALKSLKRKREDTQKRLDLVKAGKFVSI